MGKIHDEIDNRNIAINNVGICKYKLPIIFNNYYNFFSIAEFKIGVALSSTIKGAHLSRIIEILDRNFSNKKIRISFLRQVLEQMLIEVEVDNVNLDMSFDIVISTKTPVTNKETFINSNVNLSAKLNNDVLEKSISLTTNGSMLCPNSKKISNYGAHSQKCNMKVTLYGDIDNISVDKAIKIMMDQFSSEVYGIVKSKDEKVITEKAYNNPKFSEDLIRDTLINLRKYYPVGKITVEIENLESIHQHNVYAIGEIE